MTFAGLSEKTTPQFAYSVPLLEASAVRKRAQPAAAVNGSQNHGMVWVAGPL